MEKIIDHIDLRYHSMINQSDYVKAQKKVNGILNKIANDCALPFEKSEYHGISFHNEEKQKEIFHKSISWINNENGQW